MFRYLRETPTMQYEHRVELKDVIRENEEPVSFTGVMERKEDTYGFIRVDGRGNRIFAHKDDVKKDSWEKLTTGSRCSFNIGFTFLGPKAIAVESE